MKKIKNAILYSVTILILFFCCGMVSVNAEDNLKSYTTPSGTTLYYRGTNNEVKTLETYVQPESDFRAVWISHLVNDVGSNGDELSWKKEMYQVLDICDYYNINAIIFHLRIKNDALYNSKLNSLSGYLAAAKFDIFDPIEWLITEAHRRGIEFHAWLNPYRISSAASSQTPEQIAAQFPTANVASDPDCILKGTGGVILNPAVPKVRNFLVNTCIELAENYDIDGIHFDDYFYIAGVNDDELYQYDKIQFPNKDDWRREQINLFMKKLSTEMRAFNKKTNRCVQIGVSPTGIYRNGNGVVSYDDGKIITTGSSTAGYAHYGSPLFADTLKWAIEGWIDYLLPQSYWAMDHPQAGYGDVMGWWNNVAEYLNCNVYSGMGIYFSAQQDKYAWSISETEALDQLLYRCTLDNIRGTSFFSFSNLSAHSSSLTGKNLKNLSEYAWYSVAIQPEVRTYSPVILSKAENIEVKKYNDGFTIRFKNDSQARKYAIYRSEDELKYTNDELIDVIGASTTDVITFADIVDSTKEYNYGIVPISNTNSMGESASVNTKTSSSGTRHNYGKIIAPSNLRISTDKSSQINWDNLYVPFGSTLTYSIEISTDNTNFQGFDTDIFSAGSNKYFIYSETDYEKTIYIKIRGTNEFGDAISDVIQVEIIQFSKKPLFAISDLIKKQKEKVKSVFD